MVSDVLSPAVVVHPVLLLDKVYVCLHVCTVCHQHTSCRKSASFLFHRHLVKSKYKTQAMANAQSSVATRRTQFLQQWGLLYNTVLGKNNFIC